MCTCSALSKTTGRAGFTLVELSIVLVIIGLIIGGVLVGRDLVYAAKIRKAVSTIEKYNTAVETFRGKYNCLPGDCPTAIAMFASPYNGDGNGFINMYGFNYSGSEAATFWQNLAAANLISFNISMSGFSATLVNGSNRCNTDYPCFFDGDPSANLLTAAAEDNSGALNTIGPNYWYITSDFAPGGSLYPHGVYGPMANGQPGLIAKVAFDIDTKMDDGLPYSGRMQAVWSASYLYMVPFNDPSNWMGDPYNCTNTSTIPTTYAVTNISTRACYIRIAAPF